MLRKACARRRSTACHRTYRHASTSAIVGAGTTSKASSPAGAGSSASASTTMPFASSEQHASVILAEDGSEGRCGGGGAESRQWTGRRLRTRSATASHHLDR